MEEEDENQFIHGSSLDKLKENSAEIVTSRPPQVDTVSSSLDIDQITRQKNPRLSLSSSKNSTSSSLSIVSRCVSSVPIFRPKLGSLGTEIISETQKLTWLAADQLYECNYCGILYQDDILHDLHMHAHSIIDPFICVCGYDARGPRHIHNFNYHLIYSDHQLPARYTSPLSPWSPLFPTPGSLGTPSIPADCWNMWMDKATIYECAICRILFDDDAVYDIHRRMHRHTAFGYSCVCGFASDKYQFTAHLYTRKHPMA